MKNPWIPTLLLGSLTLSLSACPGTQFSNGTPSVQSSPATPSETQAPETTPDATPEPTPEATPEATPEPTPEATPEATPEPTSEATPEPTSTPPPAMPAVFAESSCGAKVTVSTFVNQNFTALVNPEGLVQDSRGFFFIADTENDVIRLIPPVGPITTYAGGQPGYATGVGTSAQFRQPHALAFDADGKMYITDGGNHNIRQVDSGANIILIAGDPENAGILDTPQTKAKFNQPHGIAVDNDGNLYIADQGNHAIRKIDEIDEDNGRARVTTIAGGYPIRAEGYKDSEAALSRFSEPHDLVLDSAGNIYLTDRGNNAIRRISFTGIVTTLAGGNPEAGFADGKGSAAQFNAPEGIAIDDDGFIYVADSGNHALRKIAPNGEVITIAGAPPPNASSGTQDGAGASALLDRPTDIVLSGCTLHVLERSGAIRRLRPAN